MASSLFLQHNNALVPPYRVLIDTNFINFSLQNKLELVSGMMDCLYAKCGCRPYDAPGMILTSTLRHSMCDELRDGRVGEAGTQISGRLEVRR